MSTKSGQLQPREKELELLERRGSGERIAAGVFTIDPAHPALPGHFPGRPVVPGVMLLAEALALIAQRTGGWAAGFENVKFLAPVKPGQIVAVDFIEARSGRIAFACSVEGRSVLRATARIGGPASRDTT